VLHCSNEDAQKSADCPLFLLLLIQKLVEKSSFLFLDCDATRPGFVVEDALRWFRAVNKHSRVLSLACHCVVDRDAGAADVSDREVARTRGLAASSLCALFVLTMTTLATLPPSLCSRTFFFVGGDGGLCSPSYGRYRDNEIPEATVSSFAFAALCSILEALRAVDEVLRAGHFADDGAGVEHAEASNDRPDDCSVPCLCGLFRCCAETFPGLAKKHQEQPNSFAGATFRIDCRAFRRVLCALGHSLVHNKISCVKDDNEDDDGGDSDCARASGLVFRGCLAACCLTSLDEAVTAVEEAVASVPEYDVNSRNSPDKDTVLFLLFVVAVAATAVWIFNGASRK